MFAADNKEGALIKRVNSSSIAMLSSTVLCGGLMLAALQVNAAEAASDPATSTTNQTSDSAAGTTNQPDDQTKGNNTQENETTDLGKVVVHARNRLEPLKDVPLSISVVTGKELERLDATDVKAVLQRAGNVSWNQGNQRTSSIAIRGIGKIGQTEAQDPSVGVIFDGVNYGYNALTSSYDFVDIDSVEVTRGPQGTLLGKNTSVGVVNITSKRPSFESSADYALTFGQNNFVQAWSAGGGAVVDDLLAWRGTFSFSKGRGDIVNAYNYDDTYFNKDRVTGRVQFLLTPTENLSVRLIAESSPRAGEHTNGRTFNTPTPAFFSDGVANTTLTNEKRLNRSWFTQQSSYSVASAYWYGAGINAVDNDSARPLITGSNGASAEIDWHVGTFDVTSITAYRDYHFDAVNDEGTPFDVNRNSGGFFNDYKQFSQELRVSSQIGKLVDYQAGLFLWRVNNDALYQRVWGDDAGAWFATDAQYSTLNKDAYGQVLLRNSLAGLSMAFNSPAGLQNIRNKSAAIFAQANWHLSEPLTLTTGVRFTHEDRENTGSTYIRDNGSGAELNPYIVNNILLGGFNSTISGAVFNGTIGNAASTNVGYLNTTDPAQVALADATARKYFNVSTYAALTGAQAAQIAAAKALRQAQIGVVFNPVQAESFKKTQPSFVVSPSYKFNDKFTSYLSWQYGEKPGIAQLVNGISMLVQAEKTNDFELGFKSILLNRTLTFNTTLYVMDIKNYQQAVRVLDTYTTALNQQGNPNGDIAYTSATGNVPKVQSKGVEIDAVYAGLPNTTIRVSGAYNEAIYKQFPNSAQPAEYDTVKAGSYVPAPYRDVSGQALAGAPKWAFNLGIDYRLPVTNVLEA
ncbi:MAG: TonB-dependent receptor, partial [Steroidobacter sp.]